MKEDGPSSRNWECKGIAKVEFKNWIRKENCCRKQSLYQNITAWCCPRPNRPWRSNQKESLPEPVRIGYMKERRRSRKGWYIFRRKWIIERYIMKRTRRLNKTDVEDKIGICFNGKEINGETGVKNKSNEFIFTRFPRVEQIDNQELNQKGIFIQEMFLRNRVSS